VPPAQKQIQDVQNILRNSAPFTYPSEEALPLFKTQSQTDDGNSFPALEAEPPRAVSHRHCTFAWPPSQQFSARQRTTQLQGSPGTAQSI